MCRGVGTFSEKPGADLGFYAKKGMNTEDS